MLDPKVEFPWHQKTWDKFAEARSRKHLPHALLITGEEGIGKKAFAQKLLKSLLCFKPINNQPCHQCNGCKTYESGSNPDFMAIQIAEDKKQISVDQIRELSKFITLSRSFEAYRVILLQPVEAMNNNAANSLLKSLEEPADNTIIILLATYLNQLLPTIKSRCQLLTLPKPTSSQASDWLQANYPEIKDVETRLDLSFGRPLLVLASNDEGVNQAAEFAGDILQVLEEKKSITEAAKIWEKSEHSRLIDWQLSWLQTFIKEAQTGVNHKGEDTSLLAQHLSKIKHRIKIDPCWDLYQQVLGQKKYIHTSVNPLMFIENMLTLWFKASRHANS
jgi:DNA polymerase-3 subunit delta'